MKAQKTIEQFIEFWKQDNFEEMYKLTQLTWQAQVKASQIKSLETQFPTIVKKLKGKIPEMKTEEVNRLRQLLDVEVIKCDFLTIDEVVPAVYDASLKIQYKAILQVKQAGKLVDRKNLVTRKVKVRILGEKEPYKPDPAGQYGVNPISLINNLY